MKELLTKKTLSSGKAQKSASILTEIVDSPADSLDDNTTLDYFLPKHVVEGYAGNSDIQKTVDESIKQNQGVLDYLKNK